MLPETTQVFIVGAGPSGLALGATLAAAKIDFVLADRLAAGQNTSRAAGIHARTLEVLEGVGASDRLVAAGIQVPIFAVRDRDKTLLKVSFADLETRYPYVLALPQNETEAILGQRVAELGGRIHRSHDVVAMEQDGEGADIVVRAGSGPARTVRARYVVGADGYHSLVREQAGIGFQPGTYPQSFVLGDVRMDWPFGTDEAQLFLSPGGLLAVVPLPRGRRRIIASLDEAPEHPTRDDLQAVLDGRGPQQGKAWIHQLHWSSRFRLHHGVAARYRAGRAFVVGDAAHVHSPAGGQGMNIGIQDACDLGGRLAAVLQGRADDAALDGYEAARRPVAERVVALTDRLTRIVTVQGSFRQELRNLAIEIVGHLPGARQSLAKQLSELSD